MKTPLEIIEALASITDLKYCWLTESHVVCAQECGGEGGKPGPCPQNKPENPESSGKNQSGGSTATTDKKPSKKVAKLASMVTAKSKKAGAVVSAILKGGIKLKKKAKDRIDSGVVQMANAAAATINATKDKVTGSKTEPGQGWTSVDVMSMVNSALAETAIKVAENQAYAAGADQALDIPLSGIVLKGMVYGIFYISQKLAKAMDAVEAPVVNAVKKAAPAVGKVIRKGINKLTGAGLPESKLWLKEEADLAGDLADQVYDMLADSFGPEVEEYITREDLASIFQKAASGESKDGKDDGKKAAEECEGEDCK